MTRWKSPTLAATLLVLGAIALVGPTAPPVGAQTKAPGPPITLRLTWTTSLDTHVGKGATHFVNRAKELTNGQVNVLLFPNSGLGSEQQALEGMQAGTVDMGLITVFTNAVKVGVVLDLPFLFRDVAHWKKSVEGPPGRAIAETAPAAGVRILAWYLGGWRDVYGSRAIKSVDDFKGLKIRTQQAVALVEFFKAVGAIPTPIAWPETYLALQQKTVDAAETALWAMYDAKQYEVAKFAVETHHAQSNIPVMMSEQKWKTLSPEIQQALVTGRDGVRRRPAEGLPARGRRDGREAQGEGHHVHHARPRAVPRRRQEGRPPEAGHGPGAEDDPGRDREALRSWSPGT